MNSDVARFTTHIKPVLQQIRLLTGLNMGGKTRNIAIQLVLQQCCRTSCTFFVARFSVPLGWRLSLYIMRLHFFYSAVIANERERFLTDN